jgi:hypothetical protein
VVRGKDFENRWCKGDDLHKLGDPFQISAWLPFSGVGRIAIIWVMTQSSVLKMEAIGSFVILVIAYKTTQLHNPADYNPDLNRCEDLKSHTSILRFP